MIQAPGPTLIYKTRLKRLAKDDSQLVCRNVSNEDKKVL